jgi:RNA polymerase sigma-70 factor (ECF subfamily)
MSSPSSPASWSDSDAESLEEQALLEALRRGEESAFERMVRVHGGQMLSIARRFLGNEEDARDAVQDAFISAFKSIDQFEGKARLATWLNRIAINASLARLRQRQRKQGPSIDELLPKFLEDGHPEAPAAEWRESAETAVQLKETRSLVREAIDQLPDTYRTVLLLRDIEGLETEEVARMLGVTGGVVKIRLHRARQALRSLLDPLFRGGAV